jgi:hypothetical protein
MMKESHRVGQPALDPEEFLERLRAEHHVLRWEPLPPDHVKLDRHHEQIRNRESLEYLHHHWVLPDEYDPEVGGTGIRGKVVSAFGRMTFRVLHRYLQDERELLAYLVRVNEALEQRCDELTNRCQQLEEDVVSRQVAEAANQAKLAAWLHLDPPPTATLDGRKNGTNTGDGARAR